MIELARMALFVNYHYEEGARVGLTREELEKVKSDGTVNLGHTTFEGKDGHMEYPVPKADDRAKIVRILSQ